MVPVTEKAGIHVFLNPVINWVIVTGLSTKTLNKISVANSEGRILQSAKTQDASYKLNVKNYAPGTYTITIVQANGTGVSYKIIKPNK